MPVIQEIWANFHTIDDDKDRNNGISETYMLDGQRIVAQNRSWGKDLAAFIKTDNCARIIVIAEYL